MADALVRELNRLGYQPIFSAHRCDAAELYTYTREVQRLVRRGSARQVPAGSQTDPADKEHFGDINYNYTSEKKLDAAVSFLETALKCIRMGQLPKLDL